MIMKKFFLIIVLPILIFGSGLLYLSLKKDPSTKQTLTNIQQTFTGQSNTTQPNGQIALIENQIRWEFNGEEWHAAGGTPPACVNPLKIGLPVDIDLVRAISYPGQVRNKEYKPHGGFAFESSTNNKIAIKAPFEAQLIKASRYIEQGEVQYLLVFTSQCGLMYRLDHLSELTPKYQVLMNNLPPAKVNDSRTTAINPPVTVPAGEPLATKIGFSNTRNVMVDFGVYNLRRKNGVTGHDKEYAPYGICWLNLFTESTNALIKSLPAQDQGSGKTSDYCK